MLRVDHHLMLLASTRVEHSIPGVPAAESVATEVEPYWIEDVVGFGEAHVGTRIVGSIPGGVSDDC